MTMTPEHISREIPRQCRHCGLISENFERCPDCGSAEFSSDCGDAQVRLVRSQLVSTLATTWGLGRRSEASAIDAEMASTRSTKRPPEPRIDLPKPVPVFIPTPEPPPPVPPPTLGSSDPDPIPIRQSAHIFWWWLLCLILLGVICIFIASG
jgi:hypothetical protein